MTEIIQETRIETQPPFPSENPAINFPDSENDKVEALQDSMQRQENAEESAQKEMNSSIELEPQWESIRNLHKEGNLNETPHQIEQDLESFQESGKNLTASKKKYTKINLRTYSDLVSIIHNKSLCEWQESRYSLPMKSFTPACFWFMICANYFPNLSSHSKEEIFRQSVIELEKREFPLFSRINRQLLKNIPRSDCDDQSFFDLKERMSRRFEEVIQSKGVFDLNNDEFYSNSKHFPLKAAYTKEDDDFISQMRKYGVEKFDQYIEEEDLKQSSNYQKTMAFKQLPLDYLIELLTIDREELRNGNMQRIGEIKQAFFNEDIDKLLAEREFQDPNNILKDLEFLTTAEMDFLNYLELRQQQNLALMNMDLYDEEKSPSKTLDISLPKQEKSNEFADPGNDIVIDLEDAKESDETMKEKPGSEDIKKSPEQSNPETSKQENENPQPSNQNQSSKTTKAKIVKDDIVCQVCNDGDYSEENMIVFCSKCNISVHQKCYELSRIPVGDWICSLCKTLGPKGRYLRCPLCTRRGGVMKSTDIDVSRFSIFEAVNPGYAEYQRKCVEYFKTHDPETIFEDESNDLSNLDRNASNEKNEESYEEKLYYNFQTMKDVPESELHEEPYIQKIWIHLSCGLWTPEVFLEEKKSNINIRGVDNIDKKRFLLSCSICKTKKSGACIQCVRGKCQFSFHPECARRANHYMEIKEEEKLQYCIFCYKHTPLKLKRFLETKSKKYKKEIMKFCHNLEKFHDNYHYEQKLKETNISDKKKYIQSYISRIMKENKKKDKDFISNLLAFMKRLPENLFQVNLLKRLEPEVNYSISDTKIPKKIHLKTNIPRSDDIWKNFKYKNLNPAQLYKRYRKIIVGTKIHKNINSIKKLGNLKEIADMRAIKKLMSIEEKEDLHSKERIYDTRKPQAKPTSSLQTGKISALPSYGKRVPALPKQVLLAEEPLLEPDNTLYCLCQRVYRDGEKMIACDRCNDWLHFECVGYLGEIESQATQELKFICPRCDEKDDENARSERRKEYERLFNKYYREQREALLLQKEANKDQVIQEVANNEEINTENAAGLHESPKEELESNVLNNISVVINSENLHFEDPNTGKPHEKEKAPFIEDFYEAAPEPKIMVEIDTELNFDNFKPKENDSHSMDSNGEVNPSNVPKKPSSIEFNLITKENLQHEPTNNFNNNTITKYFLPRSTSISQPPAVNELKTPNNCPISKSKKQLKADKKVRKTNEKSNKSQALQNINIVQNINIIQNNAIAHVLQSTLDTTPSKGQDLTPPKAARARNSESITKKKPGDLQMKLDKFLTPSSKNSSKPRSHKKNQGKHPQINENADKNSLRKRGRKRKDEKTSPSNNSAGREEAENLIEIERDEAKERQESENVRVTRSKKVKH